MSPTTSNRVVLAFPGLSGPVALAGDPALVDGLSACLKGWTPTATHLKRSPRKVLAAVTKTGRGRYRLRSRFIDRPAGGLPLASAVCGLVADMAQDWAETQPGAIGLHCGAVRMGQNLLLLTGPARAGKSTLITRLAAEPGVSLFCDDVLPVTAQGRGVALGIAPRLRLPAPEGSDVLQGLVRDAGILSDNRYGYVAVPDQAAHGAQAGIGAILLLDRREGATASLHTLDPGEALSALLLQAITDFHSAEDAFARTKALTEGRPCLRLVYSDLEQATRLVLRIFGRDCMPPPDFRPAPELLPPPVDAPADPVALDAPFRRDPRVRLRRHGQAAYLWHPDEAMLWKLDPIGGAIWDMLDIPATASDLADVLAEHFAQVPIARLQADVASLLGGLQKAGLIQPLAAPNPVQKPSA